MKKSIKILSVFLAVLTFFGILSVATPVFAADVNEYIADKEYTEKLLTEVVENDTEEKAPIVKEIEEKRDENKKVYLREDGTYTSVISKTPVHYEKDGEWVDIVNDLKTDGDVLTNTAGNFNVEFPKEISEDNEIKIENGKETITFSIVETEKSNGKVKNNKKQKQDKSKASDEEIFNNDISRTVSEIEYEDVLENTNLEYIVTPNGVKENIIVENKESLKKSYSFNITKGKLKAELDKSNNLYFKNNNGEVVFTIPAPVMTDSNGAISYDIDVKVKNLKKETITLTYTPDKKWLNAKDRVYPVAIDPVIIMESDREQVIEDTIVVVNTENQAVSTQNNIDNFLARICESDTFKSDVLVKLNMDVFESFKRPNIAVTDVHFVMGGNVFYGNIVAKEINGTWEPATITGADVYPELAGTSNTPTITYDSEIIDYISGSTTDDVETELAYFNITNVFNDWLVNPNSNNGFALTVETAGTDSLVAPGGKFTNSKGNTTYYDSYCSIDYVEANGYNSNFEYLSQDIGRAGTFNVNTFTRGLSGYREDLSLSGNLMPVTLGFNFNSSLTNFLDWQRDYFSVVDEENYTLHSPYGDNWTPNYLKAIMTIDDLQYFYFTETGSLAVFNVTTDEDGNIVFEEDGKSESGYELNLIDSEGDICSENLVITNLSGEKEYFNDEGFLMETCDDETTNKITITYADYTTLEPDLALPKISTITDGANRTYNFGYTNDKLTSVTCKSSSGAVIKAGTTDESYMTEYSYSGNNLETVSYPTDNATTDPMQVSYTYDSLGNLKKAQNTDYYNYQYDYDSLNKVISIMEFANTTQGNVISINSLSALQTKVVDAYNGTNIYQFNKIGEIQYTFDEQNKYCKSDYAISNDESVYDYSSWRIASQNLLKNGSFEKKSNSKADNWTNSFQLIDIDSSSTFSDWVCKISSSAAISNLQTQSITVNGGKNYTFSLYAKNFANTLSDGDRLYMRITAIDEDGSETSKSRQIAPTNEFEQYSVSVSTETEIEEITVDFGLQNKSGNFYVNNAQLESFGGTAEFNCIENGCFTDNLNNWSTTDTTLSVVNETINGESVKALKLPVCMPYYTENSDETISFNNKTSSAKQTVKLNGKKGEIYSIGGWFKGEFSDGLISDIVKNTFEATYTPTATRTAQIKATYAYTDESGVSQTENFAVDFESNVDGWQYANDSFALKGDVASIDVTIITQNISNDCLVSKVELTRNKNASVVEEDPYNISYPENTATSSVSSYCPCTNCEKTNCGCACSSEDVCECVLCKRGTENTTDEKGNTVSTVKNDGNSTISTEMTYSEDGNYLETAKYDGSVISTFSQNPQYSTTSPLQVSVNGQTSNFTYNAGEHLDSVTKTVNGLSSGNQMKVEYEYKNDRIVKVNHNNYSYNFEYDNWGNIAREKVNNQTIVSYMYGANQYNKQLQKEVYENGQEIYYNYDSNGNVNKMKYNGDTDWRFTYDYTNSLATTIQDNVLNLTKEISLNNYKITDSNNNIVYSKTDTEEFYNNATYSFTKSDDVYNETSGTTLQKFTVSGISNSTKSIDVSKLVDWFDRDPENTVTINKSGSTVALERNYEYKSGQDSNATTEYIEKVSNIIKKNGTVNSTYTLKYTYDSNGNIKTVSNCSNNTTALQYEYYYDEAGQLVRVDDYINNVTTIYQYDIGGNLVSAKNYSRETYSSTSTPTSQELYTYDGTWKDKLVNVNNSQQLTYAFIGNLLTYNGKTHTWIAGRKLATFRNANCSVAFTYDENGLRSQKTVTQGGSKKTYKYTWVDGKLIGQTDGTNTLRFIYDENDEVIGFVNNDSAIYVYMKNLLGDVIAIVDENGSIVVNYEYDAWGKVLSVKDANGSAITNVNHIANVNPIRYRGYYYDTESSYYYLNSRYYDPELKRFINADKLKSLYSPKSTYLYADSVNAFAYCTNSPIRMVDYSGEKESLGSGYIAIYSFLFLLIISEYDTAFEIFGKVISRKGMISIKLYELRNKHYFAEKILPFYELIGDAVFDVMSIYATSLFQEVYYKKHNKKLKNDPTIQRPFLFSDACVSKEIKEHVIGYWYCIDRIDEKTFINSLMFVAKWNKKEVKEACERIEIYEQDAIAIDDSLAFGYFDGIRNCYMYTKADPYWRTGKIRTKSVAATWKYRKIPTDML